MSDRYLKINGVWHKRGIFYYDPEHDYVDVLGRPEHGGFRFVPQDDEGDGQCGDMWFFHSYRLSKSAFMGAVSEYLYGQTQDEMAEIATDCIQGYYRDHVMNTKNLFPREQVEVNDKVDEDLSEFQIAEPMEDERWKGIVSEKEYYTILDDYRSKEGNK